MRESFNENNPLKEKEKEYQDPEIIMMNGQTEKGTDGNNLLSLN